MDIKNKVLTGILVAIFVLPPFLSGCKTKKAVESNTSIDSVRTEKYVEFDYDSIIRSIKEYLEFDCEYKIVKWSKPDSSGVQHKEEEVEIKVSGKSGKDTEESIISNDVRISSDSTSVNKTSSVKETPVDTKTWFDRVKIWIGNYIIYICLSIGIILLFLFLSKTFKKG